MSALTIPTRLITKKNSTPGAVATVPPSEDHTDGSWSETDLYLGESLINTADNILFYRTDTGIVQIALPGADGSLLTANVSLTQFDILQLNSTPYEVVAEDGAGRTIEVISASYYYTNNSDPYSGEEIVLMCAGATISQMGCTEALKSTITRGGRFIATDIAMDTTDTQMVPATRIDLMAVGKDPTSGNGTLQVSITYRFITF